MSGNNFARVSAGENAVIGCLEKGQEEKVCEKSNKLKAKQTSI